MALDLHASLGRPAYPPGAPQAVYALLDLAAAGVAGRLPLDLRLVLDVSGSMSSEAAEGGRQSKLDLLAEAAQAMLALVEPGDHVKLVAFDDNAKVLFDRSIRKPQDRHQAQAALAKLRCGGGTRISRGLEAAVAGGFLPDHVARVVLVTDGETSNDEAACERLAFDQRGRAAWLVYGIGIGYNDAFLDRLAQANGGSFVHLGAMAGARDTFAAEMRVMGAVALTGLVAEILPAPGVELTRVDRIVPQVLPVPVQNPAGLTVDLGDLDRVRGQKLLLQLTAPALAAGSHPLASIRVGYHVPSRKLLNQQATLDLMLVVDPAAAGLAGDAEVLRTVQLAGAGRLYTLGLAEAAGGQADASARTLASAAGLYDGLGLAAMGDQLRTLTSGLATRGALDEDAKRTLTTMARASWQPPVDLP